MAAACNSNNMVPRMASRCEVRQGRQLLPELLRDIAARKQTGFLRLSRGKISKSIAFESGEPINAFSSIPSEHLDGRLIKEGRATAALVSVVKRGQPDPALLGPALVEKGVVAADVMMRTAEELAAQITVSLFQWTDAEYCFEESEKAPCHRVMQASAADLIVEGTRQAASKQDFVNVIAPLDLKVARSQPAGSHVAVSAKLNSIEGYVFSLANSPTRLSEIGALAGLPDEQIGPAVCVLLALGLLTRIEEPGDQPPAPVELAEPGLPEGDVRSILEGIERKLRLFQTASCYEILGVGELASPAAIDDAYDQLEKMFESHLAEFGDRGYVRRPLEDLFAKVKAAYKTLSDSPKRREYDRGRTTPAPASPPSYPVPRDSQSIAAGEQRRLNQPGDRPATLRKPVPIPVAIPLPTPPIPSDLLRRKTPEPVIERGQSSVSRSNVEKTPFRKPIPIPEIQMPAAPKNGGVRIERGQWESPGLAPPPPRPSGPLTRPPAVLSPEEASRFEAGANKEDQALHFYRQGRIRFERHELDAAAHLFRAAVRLDPTKSSYHFYLAVALSIRANARYEHLHHEGCHVTCKLGGTLVSNPKVRYEAEKHFLRAAEIDPSNGEIAFKLGLLYKDAGLLKKAEIYLKQALMLGSNNKAAKRELEALYEAPQDSDRDNGDIDVALLRRGKHV